MDTCAEPAHTFVEEPILRAWFTRWMRSGAAVVILALSLAPAASGKFSIVLSLSSNRPEAGTLVRVAVRVDRAQPNTCRMRLLAVAPGVGRQTALDAFVIGGYAVNGPQGNTFHPLEPTRRMGFLRTLTRVGSKTWRATIRFPKAGRWRLIVPNWCAPGYAATAPVDRIVTVR